MRLTLIILALATGLSAFSGAKIEWDHTRHDFGAFNESMGAVTARFVLRNTGGDTLVITGARANCGCTTPRLSATEIAPGDTAVLTVAYDPAGRPGRFDKRVYVDANTDPKRSTLTITGVTVGAPQSVSARYPVEVGPLRLSHSAALLGHITKGHVKSMYEGGYNASTDTLRPVVTDAPKWLEVSTLSPTVGPGEGVSFNFFINSSKIPDWDVVTDTVTVRPFAGSTDFYRMPVVVTVDEDFSKLSDKELANAPAVSVKRNDKEPLVIDKPQVSTEIEITNTGKSPLKIRRIYTLMPGVTFDIKRDTTIGAGKSRKVRVDVPAEALGKNKIATMAVNLVTNDPLTPRTTVSIPIVSLNIPLNK